MTAIEVEMCLAVGLAFALYWIIRLFGGKKRSGEVADDDHTHWI
jgi:hypothetical protein